jgi:hypothetical protein
LPDGSRASWADRFRAASTARAQLLLRSPASARWAAYAAVAGATVFLLARLAPDVHDKPLFEDEAVSGLISARSPWEILVTTLWDRGGAPLHFVLAHAAFLFDSSPSALRSLSVFFALGTVALCYDLGRRLDGRICGVVAAIVAAGSGMLAVYGTFGRMYALLAFVAALAADLFVRALDRRTTVAAAAAAGGAWLLPAVHPYGGLVVLVEAVVALVLWRGRPLKAALPVVAIGLALVPFLVADIRLATRFEVSSEASGRLATPEEAWNQLTDALRGFAGGSGWTFAIFLALAVAGAALLGRRRAPFVAWGLGALLLPPLLAMAVQTGRAPDLSPRHLVFALPFWAAFIGAAVARAPFRPLAVVSVALLAAFSSQGINDPRSITYTAELGSESALAAPARYLKGQIQPGDILYPYSSVFLAALPEAGEAYALPRGQAQSLLAALDHVDYPAGDLYLAIPTGTSGRPGNADAVSGEERFGAWSIVRVEGPFPDRAAVLRETLLTLSAAGSTISDPPPALEGWFTLNERVLCESLSKLGVECGTE